MKFINKKNILISVSGIILSFILTIIFIPVQLEPEEGYFSKVVLDNEGAMLRMFLNMDEQWVYPDTKMPIPEKLKTCVINFEDKRFDYHFGIDPVAVLRAAYLNIKNGRIVSGGSTITMQLARIRDQKKRTLANKFYEALQSVKFEVLLSKDEILKQYLNCAPYGRNIIGYQTASLKYFGKYADQLSWAEATLLAVLPNSPGGMSPGINHGRMIKKRNLLLKRLFESKIISEEIYKTAVLEKVIISPHIFPKTAPHATEYCIRKSKENIIRSTIDSKIQQNIEEIVKRHAEYLRNNGINNLSVLVCDTRTGKVRAYIGSQDYWDDPKLGKIDGVQASRSSGSILKPFLYAKCIDDGIICENSLIEDIPVNISSFSPQNADDSFSGIVRTKDALTKSLNVPAVILLKKFGLTHFYEALKKMGITTLSRPADDYGLSLIIGGAETSLWEVTNLYRGLANYGDFGRVTIFESDSIEKMERSLTKGASYIVLKILEDVKRPGIEYFWNLFENSRPVSWKTGTSYAHKDAWAMGVTTEWTVGVWAGNFDGETNKMISGAQTAGPVLFDILNRISSNTVEPFYAPANELKTVNVCIATGYIHSENCPETESVMLPKHSQPLQICPYHQKIYLSMDEKEQVCSLCWEKGHKEKTVLKYPPLVTRTMQKAGSEVDQIPEHKSSCPSLWNNNDISIVYPQSGSRIYIPTDIGGAEQKIKMDVAHTQKDSRVFWYIDSVYYGQSEKVHSLSVSPEKGIHTIKVIDSNGKSDEIKFEVL
ncbi:MAG: penicillin-binding protein 1C [Candidatus Delongbacteria bacterium]|nr:penicillin-binding protein 1C [Candidatus Delongbacteria bacterium]MCG2761061.1 penicillin-binding protein 1C [Candidatus Delongbacteria bacterium]